MYMIEISEDKLDSMVDCIAKSIKHLSKVAEMFEDLKDERYYDNDDDDEDDDYEHLPKRRSLGMRAKAKKPVKGGRYMGY